MVDAAMGRVVMGFGEAASRRAMVVGLLACGILGQQRLLADPFVTSLGIVPGHKVNGEATFDELGQDVSGAGDVNGDGLADILIGIPFSDVNALGSGRLLVFFGRSGNDTIQPSTLGNGIGGFVVDGVTTGQLGHSVGAAGDVNGDGLGDVIVGAPLISPPAQTQVGRAFVVFGKTSTAGLDAQDIISGGAGFVLNGEYSGDKAGWSVAGAGDVNGDGLNDLIVGARYNDAGGADAGKAYVVFGKTSTSAVELFDVSGGTGGFAIVGSTAGVALGNEVASAGDVNGDGRADVIVGAPYSNANGANSGRAYVVFGKGGTGLVNASTVAAGTGGFVITGEAAGDLAGYSVSGAGDVNSDGLADVVVGAHANAANGAGSGRAYVIFGKTTTSSVPLGQITAGTGGFVINASEANAETGRRVSAAGDVDGDGHADLIIGSPMGLVGIQPYGRADIVFGKTSTTPVALSSVKVGLGGFSLAGEFPFDRAGHSVAAAGDVDGDGLADLVVGTTDNDVGGLSSGRAYIVYSLCTPPTSSDYTATIAAGDPIRWGVGTHRFGNDRTIFPDSRTWVDFGVGSDPSQVTVRLARSSSGLSGITASALADVAFGIVSDRELFSIPVPQARVTFRYTDEEIAGLNEPNLRLFAAPSAAGPWRMLANGSVNAGRNQITADATTLSPVRTFFAIAELQNGDANADGSVDVRDYTAIRNLLANIDATPLAGDADVDNDGDTDNADANAIRNFIVNGTPLP